MYLKHHGTFGGYAPKRLLLKYGIILKGVLSSRTEVDSEWVEELQQKKAIGLWSTKSCFVNKTTTEDLADRTAQKQQQTWESDNTVW